MAIYTFPDVYIQKQKPQPNVVIASSNITTCALIGQAQRGERNKVILIKSWAQYIENFAKDMSTPFVPEQSYLAYAVYGYFHLLKLVILVLRLSTIRVMTFMLTLLLEVVRASLL